MRCFIHTNVEAIAACRQCGKGMCENCSAYSGHTGICPECRRNEFIAEVNTKQARVEELAKNMKKKPAELKKTMNASQKEVIENNIISEKVIKLLKEKNNIK